MNADFVSIVVEEEETGLPIIFHRLVGGDCLIIIIPKEARPLLCSGPVDSPLGVRRGFFMR